MSREITLRYCTHIQSSQGTESARWTDTRQGFGGKQNYCFVSPPLMLSQPLAGTSSCADTLLLTPLWDTIPCSNSTWQTKMLTLIYTDIHNIWQSHNELHHASALKRCEQDKHRQLAATITFGSRSRFFIHSRLHVGTTNIYFRLYGIMD